MINIQIKWGIYIKSPYKIPIYVENCNQCFFYTFNYLFIEDVHFLFAFPIISF